MFLRLSILLFFLSGPVMAKNLYDFTLSDSKGETKALSDYKNKVVMIVNIATKCGYTPQLDELEILYKKYQQKDFLILGIPSNDFGGQNPETSESTAKFCRLKYGVSFPIMEKVIVKGDEKTEFFKWIKETRPKKEEIAWNFEKFLFDKNGSLVKTYKSKVTPLSSEIVSQVEKLIEEKE